MPKAVPGQVADSLRRSTVRIECSGGQSGSGSGFVIAPGRVITNAHVVAGPRLTVESWEGRSSPAVVLRVDRRRDLALIEVKDLRSPPVSMADSRELQPGTPVFAVGNPMGFVGAVSSGSVRASSAVLTSDYASSMSWICSDIRLAPGSSGGPLANYSGHVVGVNTMIASGGIALASPSRGVQMFLNAEASPLTFGATARAVRWRDGGSAIMILEVMPDGAADLASLLPGDVLISANGQRLRSAEDLECAIFEARDTLLHLDFYRGDHASLRQVCVRLKHRRSAA